VGALRSWVLVPIAPDASLNQGDRQHAAWMYSGILALAILPIGDVGARWQDIATRRVASSDRATRSVSVRHTAARHWPEDVR